MTDPLHRLTLDLLYPSFVSRMRQALDELEDVGATYVATLGYRSLLEQQGIYAIGRTVPGKHAGEKGYPVMGETVSDAPGGFSSHNYGLGADFMREFDGVPSWDGRDYGLLGEACERAGLVWGGRWKSRDWGHIQWPGFVTGKDLAPIRTIFLQTSSLADVWAYVTSHSPTFPNQVPPKGSTT